MPGSMDAIADEHAAVQEALVGRRGRGRPRDGEPGVEELARDAKARSHGDGQPRGSGDRGAARELDGVVLDPSAGVVGVDVELEVHVVDADPGVGLEARPAVVADRELETRYLLPALVVRGTDASEGVGPD